MKPVVRTDDDAALVGVTDGEGVAGTLDDGREASDEVPVCIGVVSTSCAPSLTQPV